MAAFGNQIDILNYSCKLNDLDDDYLFLIASSYEAEAFDKKIYTINSIINKIKLLSKEDFMKFDEKINELLKKKEEKKLIEKEKNKSRIFISDKIFFVFAPDVDVTSTKIFYFLPMNAFVAFFCIVFGYVFYDSFSRNINFREMLMTFLQFYSCLILFIAMTNENSSFAKISLYSFEFLLIIFLLPSNLPENDLSQICAGICIFLLLIYISYNQLNKAKNKEHNKI